MLTYRCYKPHLQPLSWELETSRYINWNEVSNQSGQITIIPKPEVRGFGGIPLQSTTILGDQPANRTCQSWKGKHSCLQEGLVAFVAIFARLGPILSCLHPSKSNA